VKRRLGEGSVGSVYEKFFEGFVESFGGNLKKIE